MFREKFLHQFADLNVVSAQAGEVLHKHSGSLTLFDFCQHRLEAGTFHRNSGDAIVVEVDQVGITFLLGNLRQQLLLVLDAVTVAFEIVVTGETLI